MAAQTDNSIKVMIRAKPLAYNEENCIDYADQINTIKVSNSKKYIYDHVAIDSSQERIFEVSARPLTDKCLNDGINAAIFAYGQTGSGKTYTLQGEINNHGIVLNVVKYLLKEINEKTKSNIKYSINCSFLQIYNENIQDLIPRQQHRPPALKIYENMKQTAMIVKNVSSHPINNFSDFYSKYRTAITNRETGSTGMNEKSSRSHFITQIEITRVVCIDNKNSNDKSMTSTRSSMLSLIDLAGSENQKKSKLTGNKVIESKCINQSLEALCRVVDSLVTKKLHIPYRDSKLTYLLKHCVGGNSLTYIIGCISSSKKNSSESISTLKFISTVKTIKNKPQQNGEKISYTALKKQFNLINENNSLLKNELKKKYETIKNLKNIIKQKK
eukprot:24396_1